MKKLVSLIGVIIIFVTISMSVFAGDIVSPLMTQDDAQLYFGEVKKLTPDTITIIQKKNIKGEFNENTEYTYERKDFTTLEELKIGEVYLCAVPETRQNLMIWEVTSTDTKTLEVIGEHTFAGVMQQYLNEGMFEKAEQERLAKIGQKDNSNTSVIGGADKPTNILVKSSYMHLIILGVCAIILVILIIIKRKN